MLLNNVKDEKMKFGNKYIYIERLKMRKIFNGFRKVVRGLKIYKPMGHKMQLICATLIIKHSFHKMMEDVW
jgi:hypothetical protein